MLPGERIIGGLTCTQVLEHLSAYLDDELGAPMRIAIETHAAGCSRCEQFGVRFGTLLNDVKAHLGPPSPVPPDVDQRLRLRLRASHDS